MTSSSPPEATVTDVGFPNELGELGALIGAFEWSLTPLGPMNVWPESMRAVVDTVLRSPVPMLTLWGTDGVMIYNDAYAKIAGSRHPSLLGTRVHEGLPEAVGFNRHVLQTGMARVKLSFTAQHFLPGRCSGSEDACFDFSYSPIADDQGGVLGILCVAVETARKVNGGTLLRQGEEDHRTFGGTGSTESISQRKSLEPRQALLLALTDRFRNSSHAAEIVSAAAEAVGREIGATRVGFGEIGLAHETATFETGWSDGTVDRRAGNIPVDRLFPGRMTQLRAGRTLVVGGAEFDPVPGQGLAGGEIEPEMRSGIIVPLIREGRFRALFLVENRTPRSWLPEEVSLVEDVTSRTWDALERAQAVAILRRNQARQGFLLVLGDRLRELDDPDEIMETVAETVGRHLRLSRVGYGEVLPGGEIVFATGWSDGSVSPLVGELTLDSLGRENVADLLRGLTITFDATVSGGPEAVASSSIMRGLGSAAAVPLIRDGKLRGALILGQARHHSWSSEELALAGEVAARLWEALERARAEAALHDLNATLENRVAQRTLELTSSEARFRTLFENAPAPIFLIRVGPGKQAVYDAVNAAAERFMGRPACDIVGKSVSQATSDGEPLLDRCIRCAVTGQPMEYEINIDGGGDWRIAECVLAPLPIEDDDTQLLIGIARDITGQRLAEEQLRQAQKMEAIGQLTGGIAHDFNNLLTGIIGSLALMEKRLAQGRTDAIQRYVGLALMSANRAAALTQRLLAFSRRQPLEAKSVDVNALVASMDDLLRRTLGESVVLETIVSDDVWLTLCDPHQLENALLNLAINGRDAMPDGGRLTIGTGNIVLDDVHGSREPGIGPGQYVVVSVADTGTGMPPDVITRAFDPFFTTKPIGQGTGLGLSMIYGFAKQSEGHVKIHSEVGRGTTVKIFLPRHTGHDEPEVPESPGAIRRAEAGETVLVVEDNATVRGLALEVLQDMGYTAIEAGDGPAGLRALQSGRRIDLLITDVGLPGMNGRQLAEQARTRRPDLKILFITGYAENAVFGSGRLEAGMQMMTKPFTVEELAARIYSILGRS